MCGIAGRFHPFHLPADGIWYKQATKLLQHRGPDGTGHYLDQYCELVHRRLAIIDLSPTGHQPMPNEDKSVYVIFNGEIYNHRELRAELERNGHRFGSTADTEVLVHLYEEHGPCMVDRLRGMFAFAIYDLRRRQLLLARDQFGIKPLYYAVHEGQCVFASEIKAILALQGMPRELDRQACYDYLGLGYVPEPATGFVGIQMLPLGSTLVLNDAGHKLAEYYQLRLQLPSDTSLADATNTASEHLHRAVSEQSIADVPTGALLSGGIDSSLITAAYSRVLDKPPTTFNVRFPGEGYDETPMALAVSRQFGTRHHTIDLADWTIDPDSLTELLVHFDQPFADTSLIPMYSIARAVREAGVICALSGDGGDEVFGGYARFWRANKLVQLSALPDWARRSLAFVGDRVAGHTRDWGRQVAKAVRLAGFVEDDTSTVLAELSNYLNDDQKQELVLHAAREGLEPVNRLFKTTDFDTVPSLEDFSRRMTENLFAVGLPGDMLRKVDMMSMRASIEIRVPMLDEQLVELGVNLPHHLKTDGQSGKLVLRSLAQRLLPTSVASHPKHGFGIPLDIMVTGSIYQWIRDLLLAPTSRIGTFLNKALVSQWINAFEAAREGRLGGTISRGGLYQRIVILVSLELWMRVHNLTW